MTKTSESLSNKIAPTPVEPKLKRMRFGFFYLLFALLLLALIAVCGFHFYITDQALQHQQALLAEQGLTIHTTEERLTQTTETLTRLTQELTAFKQLVQTNLQQRNEEAYWQLLQARYYLELAVINVQWSDNPQVANLLLKQANRLLSQYTDAKLIPIRQVLAEEITIVSQLSRLDVTGLLSQLDALANTFSQLPLKKVESIESKTPIKTSTNWQTHWQATVAKLQKLIVIQHHNDAFAPLMTPTYTALLLENIRLNLQAAQWAILERNNAVFHLALKQAIANIKRSFDTNDARTASVLSQIESLMQINLAMQKPQLGRALHLLNQYLSQSTIDGQQGSHN